MGSKRRRRRPFGDVALGDVAIVCGKDEHGLHIIRRRSQDGPLEAAVAKPMAEGRPITGEVISMRQREDIPFLFDVKTELPRADAAAEPDAPRQLPGDGPAQVATRSYRKGWDAIWGPRRARGTLN